MSGALQRIRARPRGLEYRHQEYGLDHRHREYLHREYLHQGVVAAVRVSGRARRVRRAGRCGVPATLRCGEGVA
ncbi:hypothetical protein [Nocardia wallacei]|uniref:hypothetical protein n=1 Tax=Nocardia wallacei TaxID=480035 RepID=UPI002456E385|nr:hypothetical protein [Nocardia wallacei]